MQFVRIGEYLAVSRVTGPSHNLLQIRLGEAFEAEPVCERLPSQESDTALNESELMARVAKGVAGANRKFGTNHKVTHIRYVATDSKPESTYEQLAFKLIEQVECGGEFQ